MTSPVVTVTLDDAYELLGLVMSGLVDEREATEVYAPLLPMLVRVARALAAVVPARSMAGAAAASALDRLAVVTAAQDQLRAAGEGGP